MARERQTLRRVASLIVAMALTMPLIVVSGPAAHAASNPKIGPLTPRLQMLANPAFEALSPQAQAAKLSLAVSGPGSLMERPGGRILVDIRLTDTSAATLARLEAAGAHPVYVDDALRMVTAEVPPSSLNDLAAVQPDVLSVMEVLQPMVSAACPTGDFVSEGDTQLNAATARTHYGVDGSGVTVGVISDSYDAWGGAATDVANGELPGATNPCGFTNPVQVQADFLDLRYPILDEGRAMAQIVHDLAPGADIRFATAMIGEGDFAQQIRDLATAGAKVIVDDILYFDEPMYQDGVVGKAVEDVVAGGVTYFSAAGNENIINVASYETMAFRPTTCPASVVAADPGILDCHDFDPAVATDNTYGVTLEANPNPDPLQAYVAQYALGWNEPQDGITTDLDFFLLDENGTVVEDPVLAESIMSNTATHGIQEAYESITYTVHTSGRYSLVVGRYLGTNTPRFKFVYVGSREALTALEYPTGSGGDVIGPTTYGHSASRSGATVAAIPYDNPNTLEDFSSRGPATYCWGPVVGNTPAAPLSPCQTATVDMAATDGVQNSFFPPGSDPPHRFYGTSAAAPHAAAIAALILQQGSCLTPANVIAAMKTTALPVDGFGADAMGAGRIDADAAIGAASGTCGATYVSLTPTRILDTRSDLGLDGPFHSGVARTFAVTGHGGVPVGAVAVTGNLTVTQQTSQGFVALTRNPNNNPTTSTLNFPVGDNRANGVTIALAGLGTLSATYMGEAGPGATTQLIFDVTGYFMPDTTGATYISLTPARVLDSRNGTGLSGAFSSGLARTFAVTGQGGVPSGAIAVTGNLTVTNQTSPGFVALTPDPNDNPGTSTINFPVADNRANGVTVALSGTGTLSATYLGETGPSATTDLIFDVTGYFVPNTSGATYVALPPARILNSRDDIGLAGPFLSGLARTFPVINQGGVPADAIAVTGNLTVTEQTSLGFVALTPDPNDNPPTSTLNFPLGDNRANGVTVALSGTGTLSATYMGAAGPPARTELIFDVTGYFYDPSNIFDDFNRHETDSWGTASSGFQWLTFVDGDTVVGVDGAAGFADIGAGDGAEEDITAPGPWTSPDGFVMTALVAVDQIPASGGTTVRFENDRPESSDLQIWLTTDPRSSPFVEVGEQCGGSDRTSGWPGLPAGSFYVKWERRPSDLSRARVWAANEPEPTGWQVTIPACSVQNEYRVFENSDAPSAHVAFDFIKFEH